MKARTLYPRTLSPRLRPRIMASPFAGTAGTFRGTSGTAYWVYLGITLERFWANHIEMHVSTVGAGAQTAEVALASSRFGPCKAAQNLRVIVADGTLDSLTGTGAVRNTTPFRKMIRSGLHLWAGLRTAMATTQPTCLAVLADIAEGYILSTAASGVLTGSMDFTGSVPTPTATGMAPDLRLVRDPT